MRLILFVHILAGALALITGYVALYAAKGAPLHRKAGLIFVYAMLTMGIGGMVVAVGNDAAPHINVPAALLTSYLVVTSLTTVRPVASASGGRWLDIAGLIVAAGLGVYCVTLGSQALAQGGRRAALAFAMLLFATAALPGAAGDLRMIRAGGAKTLKGAQRLTRHLWRMTFALLIAALSFFIGQADVIPRPIRIGPLLAAPVLAVLVTLLYWLWKVRIRRSLRGIATVRVPIMAEAAPLDASRSRL
jgi:uncharacterized membrane protein